jgi:hypothetical protein
VSDSGVRMRSVSSDSQVYDVARAAAWPLTLVLALL